MALVEDTNVRRRLRLPVVAASFSRRSWRPWPGLRHRARPGHSCPAFCWTGVAYTRSTPPTPCVGLAASASTIAARSWGVTSSTPASRVGFLRDREAGSPDSTSRAPGRPSPQDQQSRPDRGHLQRKHRLVKDPNARRRGFLLGPGRFTTHRRSGGRGDGGPRHQQSRPGRGRVRRRRRQVPRLPLGQGPVHDHRRARRHRGGRYRHQRSWRDRRLLGDAVIRSGARLSAERG